MKNSTILALLAALLSATALQAQTIECKKQGSASAADIEAGTAAVMFVSSQGDWVITPETHDTPRPMTRRDGKYIYEFYAPLTANRESSFQLGRKGSAITERCVAKGLRSGYRTTYRLEEHADTLRRIEVQQDDSPGGYFVENKAYVEFTTTIKDLRIETAWHTTEKTSATGARIIGCVIDVPQLEGMTAALAKAQNELKALGDDYLNPRMDQLDSLIQHLQDQLDGYGVIRIGGSGIKGVDIQLAGIRAKEKRRYPIIAITETYATLIHEARTLWEARTQHTEASFYAKVCGLYERAISQKDTPQDKIDALYAELNTVKALRKDLFMAERFEQEAERAAKQNGEASEQVYKFLGGRYRALSKARERCPEIEGLDSMCAAALARIKSHPLGQDATETTVTRQRQHITGRVTKDKYFFLELKEVTIYAVNSPDKVDGDTQREPLSRVKPDGTFDFYLPHPVKYIYFNGEDYPREISTDTTDMGTITLGTAKKLK